MSNELKVKVIDTIELLKKESANQSVTKAMHNFIDATMAYIDKLELRPTKSKINELIAEPKKQIVINLFKTVLDEATGDLDNPNKRIWPLHSTTYKAIHNFICEVTDPENEARKCMLMSEDTLAKDWGNTPKQKIAEGLKHFMVNHYAGQFVPELTGPIIDLITESYPNITFGEEDVNEVLCVLHHICEVEK